MLNPIIQRDGISRWLSFKGTLVMGLVPLKRLQEALLPSSCHEDTARGQHYTTRHKQNTTLWARWSPISNPQVCVWHKAVIFCYHTWTDWNSSKMLPAVTLTAFVGHWLLPLVLTAKKEGSGKEAVSVFKGCILSPTFSSSSTSTSWMPGQELCHTLLLTMHLSQPKVMQTSDLGLKSLRSQALITPSSFKLSLWTLTLGVPWPSECSSYM